MFVDKNLKLDPINKGSVLGWGVVRNSPWELKGVYATEEQAKQKAQSLGSDYEIHFGSHRLQSDDFVWGVES
ncbi:MULTISPECIES: hypothetical protein [unclassified Shigella]|uniref:hypothetical protein n=1 Tax=unclassified Shigella TaxID=2629414 RepID=UPI000847EA76|nr:MULTISPECIES: hypothetical protein [unclassified Shigella]ODQ05708.1 hypothetical protein BGK50_19055 [Shigella sp. FC130]OEI93376.1 hypothetical protein BHE86_17925 [Shigella sp. FC1655]OEJ09272.1 hypothetical protein BHE89_08295 [Shigella sp. FC1967]